VEVLKCRFCVCQSSKVSLFNLTVLKFKRLIESKGEKVAIYTNIDILLFINLVTLLHT
jgi:hypothetical protein